MINPGYYKLKDNHPSTLNFTLIDKEGDDLSKGTNVKVKHGDVVYLKSAELDEFPFGDFTYSIQVEARVFGLPKVLHTAFERIKAQDIDLKDL